MDKVLADLRKSRDTFLAHLDSLKVDYASEKKKLNTQEDALNYAAKTAVLWRMYGRLNDMISDLEDIMIQ